MDEATKLFYIRKTLIHMLLDRGYLVTATQKDETLDDFKAKFSDTPRSCNSLIFLTSCSRDKLTLLLRKKDDPTDQIFVFFPDQVKLGVGTIRK